MSLSFRVDDCWNSWDFDRSLRVKNRKPIPVEEFSAGLSETTLEGLETLLVVNGGMVFPNWRLRRLRTHKPGSDTTVIEALDPSGVLHLFELRDIREGATAVGDGLARVLQRCADRRVEWFDDGDDDWRRHWLAQRMVAFWLEVQARDDSASTFDHLPAPDARREKLEQLTGRLDDDKSADEWLGVADELLEQMDPDPSDRDRWPREPRAVHLHLVVADSQQFDSDGVRVLQQLRDRGFRLDVWEVRLDADRQRRRGTLALRRAHFPDRRQKTFPALGGRRPTELLAQMAFQRPEIFRATRPWRLVRNKRRTILRTRLPLADEPCRGPWFGFTTRGQRLQFKTSLKIPEHLGDAYSLTDLKTQVTPVAMGAVRAWIGEMLPPDPVDDPEAARRLDHFLHHSKEWGGYLRIGDTGAVIGATGWHSGGLRSATITIDTSELEPPLEQLATLANDLLEVFMANLLAEGGRPDGWTPPERD